ncbi:GNAT family protein [Stenotrophomonas sp. 24(2023)]|uniref:GNAT family N-acetyltransferase n=1 Tax=Stenotrophomonas sp. 24(2023) TaxID=3068324 RepID=UPI0027E087B3|nr:GNAT family protein [Stenotrophomonas sp. 24(2023)]WMJ69509.1 GNAT family protein [Stenotrophomonas sp. 24(2023)]
MTASLPSVPLLRPVLRRHLLHLRHGDTVLRPLQRVDLPIWRRFHERVRRLQCHPHDPAGEDRFLASVQRSRLQHADDRLLLGVFEQQQDRLIGQLSVQLECIHAQRAQLDWPCRALLMDAIQLRSAMLALCRFLFEQVGLHRVCLLLPPAGHDHLREALLAAGFRREGVLRGHHRAPDGWQDRCLYAQTAPDWPPAA